MIRVYNVTLANYIDGVKIEAEVPEQDATSHDDAVSQATTKVEDATGIKSGWVPTYVNRHRD
jgi:hypothetical protein